MHSGFFVRVNRGREGLGCMCFSASFNLGEFEEQRHPENRVLPSSPNVQEGSLRTTG